MRKNSDMGDMGDMGNMGNMGDMGDMGDMRDMGDIPLFYLVPVVLPDFVFLLLKATLNIREYHPVDNLRKNDETMILRHFL